MTHGKYAVKFYDAAFSRVGKQALQRARAISIRDLREEAASVRAAAFEVLQKVEGEASVTFFAELMRTLCRIAATHYALNREQENDLEAAFGDVLDQIERTLRGGPS